MPYYLEKSWQRSHKHFPEGMNLPMINDGTRLDRYREFFRTNAQGRVVLDVGAGLGLIGFRALEFGAAHVYMVEQNPITAKHLRHIISVHPRGSQVTLIEGDFHAITRDSFQHVPDLMVCELWGPHLWNEGLHATHSQARKLFPEIDIYPRRYKSHFNIVRVPHSERSIWPMELVPGVSLREIYKDEYLGYLLDRHDVKHEALTAPVECFSLEDDKLTAKFQIPVTENYQDVFFHLFHEIHWEDFVQHYRSTYFYVPELSAGKTVQVSLDKVYLPLFDLA